MKRFLIGQLACFGDCLYATTVAKQIKYDYPDCHITWAIATKYKSAITLNPDVDAVWEFDIRDGDFYNLNWDKFVQEAQAKQRAGEFDELVFTQIPKANWHNFEGTIRASILGNYSQPITVSVRPVLRLSQEEIANVRLFVEANQLLAYQHIILFECAPGTGQSFINPVVALQIAESITAGRQDICFVLSSPQKIATASPHIKDASTLSFRENAELANHCTLMVGCSSGITWLSTSDWVQKNLPTIQFLTKHYSLYAGMEYEHQRWNLPTEHIVEVFDCTIEEATACIQAALDKGISVAKAEFHQIFRPNYAHFQEVLQQLLGVSREKKKVWHLVKLFHAHNQHLSFRRLLAIALKARKKSWYRFLKSLYLLPKV
jgi:hypothetical protein